MYDLDITSLLKARKAFFDVLAQSDKLEKEFYEVFRAAVIQNFEFSFELSHKFMRRWLEFDDIAEVQGILNKKELFRIAREKGLITDTLKWFDYLNTRNKISHVYDENIAEEVFKIAKHFYVDFESFIKALEMRL